MSIPAPIGAVTGPFFAVVSCMGETAAGLCFWRFFRNEDSANNFVRTLCVIEKRHDFYVVDLQNWMPVPFTKSAIKKTTYIDPMLDSIMKQERECRVDEFGGDSVSQDQQMDRPDHIMDDMSDCSSDEGDHRQDEVIGGVHINNHTDVKLHVDNEILLLSDESRTREQKYLVYSCVCPGGMQNTVSNILAMRVWAVFSSIKLVNEFMEKNKDYKMALLPENVHNFFVCPDYGFLENDADEKYRVTIEQIADREIQKRKAAAKYQEQRVAKSKRIINKHNREAKAP
jgi:hypothetical protein